MSPYCANLNGLEHTRIRHATEGLDYHSVRRAENLRQLQFQMRIIEMAVDSESKLL